MGQKLSDLTSQRVIVLILAMLIMIPGFNWNSGLYGDYSSNFAGGLSILHDAFLGSGNTSGLQQVIEALHLVQGHSMMGVRTVADPAGFRKVTHALWQEMCLKLSILCVLHLSPTAPASRSSALRCSEEY